MKKTYLFFIAFTLTGLISHAQSTSFTNKYGYNSNSRYTSKPTSTGTNSSSNFSPNNIIATNRNSSTSYSGNPTRTTSNGTYSSSSQVPTSPGLYERADPKPKTNTPPAGQKTLEPGKVWKAQ